MRNITVSVDDEIDRLARIRAAELDTSVSSLVREFLADLAHGKAGESGVPRRETEAERRARMLDEVVADITANGGGLRMADNLPRDALYDGVTVLNPFAH